MSFISSLARVGGIAALLAFVTANANAAITGTFNSSAAFQAALTGVSFNNPMTGIASGQASIPFSGNGFAYTASTVLTAGGAPNSTVYSGGAFLGLNNNGDSLVLTFTGAPVTAIGGNFFQTDIGDAFVALPVTLNFSDGSTDTYTPTGTGTFKGYTFNTPLTSVRFPGLTGTTPAVWSSMNNVRVGTAAPVAVVPEAGTFALLVPALTLGAVIVRRKRVNK